MSFWVSTAALGLALLAGCESAPESPGQGAYTTSKSGIQRADAVRQQALALKTAERDPLLVKAADLYLSENKPKQAASTLDAVNATNLPPADRLLYLLLQGESALQTDSGERAVSFLRASQNAQNIAAQPVAFRLRWHQARAQIFSQRGDLSRAIFELTRVSALLTDTAAVQQVNNSIWTLLEKLPQEDIEQGLQQSGDGLVSGWYQLAAITHQAKGDIRLQIENIQLWQQQHSGHPAAQVPPERIRQFASLRIIEASKIAILLPRDGEFQVAGDAIANGIVAAFYDNRKNGGKVPELTFYDTLSGPVVEVYQRAVSEGAQLVIGPLQRERLAELMAQPNLPVPVLGLNYVEDAQASNTNLYQFGLAIRDEASQIAEGAWEAGYRSAMVIHPANRMGEQAASAFATDWQAKGGKITSNIVYSAQQGDYSQLLEPPLLIQQSKQRAQRLQQVLGKNIEFTPRRRGDLDMIFLVGYPDQGRQIKPALDYMYASDLPVFSTSQIYSGAPNPEQDQDLDNILFTAVPWSVKAYSARMIPPPGYLPAAYKNLFAMGVDAYHLQQWLSILSSVPGTDFKGQTGNLTMAAGNRIQRRQPWVKFQNGVPVPAASIAKH